ncbi:MAG TPA: hypothetical protein VJM09_13200 [Sphingobium sp.]|nr:hypothetical protein [Sphingobium sp.]
MMGKPGWMTGSLLGATLLMGGAAVAQTQPRYGAQPGEQQEYRDDSQDDLAPQEQAQPEEDFSDVVAADDQRGAAEPNRAEPNAAESRAEAAPAPSPAVEDEESEAMVNACALAARDEAERDGGYAEVRQMELPRESRNGFSIDGDVEARSSWRAQDGQMRHFTCTLANGRIQDVHFQRERAAR